MREAQQRLDKAAKSLMVLIHQAEEGAAEACADGDHDTAAKLHRVAAYLRLGYAEGRTINAGGIRPAFGGDGK